MVNEEIKDLLLKSLYGPYLMIHNVHTGNQIPFGFFGLLIESVKAETTAVQMTFAHFPGKIVFETSDGGGDHHVENVKNQIGALERIGH